MSRGCLASYNRNHKGTKDTKGPVLGAGFALRSRDRTFHDLASRHPRCRESIEPDCCRCAYQVHTELGPGLLESVYESCFAMELDGRGVRYERQKIVPILYKGVPVEAALRLDFLINGRLVVEIKASEKMVSLYKAQVLTYLKITGLRLGMLINFNTVRIKDGIRRIVH